MTTFGFAGFAIIRPHVFSINAKDQAKREGFVHLWAVINYMLGVRDEFNICLLPVDAVEIEFDLIMRNILSPYLQVETPLFKQMTMAMLEGMSSYMPLVEYDSMMFLTRRAIGIPGYQHNIDYKLELPPRSIFTAEELQNLDIPLFKSPNILLLKVKEREDLETNLIEGGRGRESEYAELLRIEFELPEPQMVKFKEISRDKKEFQAALSDKKYRKLGFSSRAYVAGNIAFLSGLGNRFTNPVLEAGLTQLLNAMKRQQKQRKNKK